MFSRLKQKNPTDTMERKSMLRRSRGWRIWAQRSFGVASQTAFKFVVSVRGPHQRKWEIKKALSFHWVLLAGDEGFEPSQTESESGVLPLHKSPTNKSYYTLFIGNVNTFFRENKNIFSKRNPGKNRALSRMIYFTFPSSWSAVHAAAHLCLYGKSMHVRCCSWWYKWGLRK